MKTLILGLLISLGPVLSMAQSLPPDFILGKWYGQVGNPNDRVEIGFEFKKAENGKIYAFLYQPVINFYGLKFESPVENKGNTFHVSDYGIVLTEEKGRLVGTLSLLKLPMELQRVKSLPKEVAIPKFPAGPKPLWTRTLGGRFWANPIHANGKILIGSDAGVFHSIDAKKGDVDWVFNAGRPIYAEAAIAGSAVLVTSDQGDLFKLNLADGKLIWRKEIGGSTVPRILPHTHTFEFDFTSCAPTIKGDRIYIGSREGVVQCLDVETGEPIWKTDLKSHIQFNLAIGESTVIVGSKDGKISALKLTDGTIVWQRATGARIDANPTIVGDQVIIGNHGSLFASLKLDSGEPLWRNLYWGSAVWSQAVAFGDSIYVGSSDLRRVSRIDPKTGKVLWRTDVWGWSWGRASVTANTVYIGIAGVKPYEIRHVPSVTALDREAGKILWRWIPPKNEGSFLTGFVSSVLKVDSRLICASLEGTIYCLPLNEE